MYRYLNSWIKKSVHRLRSIPDRVLVKQAKNGNSEAFGKLYLKYLDPIYRYVFFRVGQKEEEAEDITETVFFKAWKKLDKYTDQQGGTFQAWLYRIARNTVIDHYRTHKQTEALEKESREISEPPNFAENLIQAEKTENLKQALYVLTDIQEEVVTLRFVEELSHREVAKILDKSEDAVRAIQYRALQRLRKELEKDE